MEIKKYMKDACQSQKQKKKKWNTVIKKKNTLFNERLISIFKVHSEK